MDNPKLSKGEIVTIYEDPLDCTKLEGHAALKEFVKGDAVLEYWRVVWTEDLWDEGMGAESLRAVNLKEH